MSDLQTRLCLGTDEGPTDPSVSGDWWVTYRPVRVWGLMRDLQTRLCLGTDEGPTDLSVSGDWWGTYRPACVWGLMRDLQTCLGGVEWHRWELKHSILNLIHCLIMLLLLVTALAITSWPRQDWPDLGPWPRVNLGSIYQRYINSEDDVVTLLHSLIVLLLLFTTLTVTSWPRHKWPELGAWSWVDLCSIYQRYIKSKDDIVALLHCVTVTFYSLDRNKLTKAGVARISASEWIFLDWWRFINVLIIIIRSMATSRPGLNLPTIY